MESIITSGEHLIKYDDDESETLNLNDEEWGYEQPSNLQAAFGSVITLQSNEQEVLSDMLEVFGNSSYMRHHTQAFDQAPLINSYAAEEKMFYPM